jgi:ribonuclease HI
MNIEVWTDGSATTPDKPGGWASVIVVDGQVHKEISGHLEKATNNDAELIAAIKGLDYASEYLSSCQSLFSTDNEVTLISDSEIILKWANGTYRFKQVDKLFLYESLCCLVRRLNVKTKWVRGHSGNILNERCDKLAKNARKGIITKNVDSVPKDTRIGIKKTGVFCAWYGDKLKVIDLQNNIIEDFDRDIHGKRGSLFEIREDRTR